MSLSRPVEEVSYPTSPTVKFLTTNARDGFVQSRDRETRDKTQLTNGPGDTVKMVVLDHLVAAYTQYSPKGSHRYSNHFRLKPPADKPAWVQIRENDPDAPSGSKILLEGNPNDWENQSFRNKLDDLRERGLRYVQILYVLHDGQIATLELKGTVLRSFREAVDELKDQGLKVSDAPVMTITVGKKTKPASGNEYVQFHFSFEALPTRGKKQKAFFEQALEADQTVQDWLDHESCRKPAGAVAEEQPAKEAAAPATEGDLLTVDDNIDDDF